MCFDGYNNNFRLADFVNGVNAEKQHLHRKTPIAKKANKLMHRNAQEAFLTWSAACSRPVIMFVRQYKEQHSMKSHVTCTLRVALTSMKSGCRFVSKLSKLSLTPSLEMEFVCVMWDNPRTPDWIRINLDYDGPESATIHFTEDCEPLIATISLEARVLQYLAAGWEE